MSVLYGPDFSSQTDRTPRPRLNPKLSTKVALERRQACDVIGAPGIVFKACVRRGDNLVVVKDDTTVNSGLVLTYEPEGLTLFHIEATADDHKWAYTFHPSFDRDIFLYGVFVHVLEDVRLFCNAHLNSVARAGRLVPREGLLDLSSLPRWGHAPPPMPEFEVLLEEAQREGDELAWKTFPSTKNEGTTTDDNFLKYM